MIVQNQYHFYNTQHGVSPHFYKIFLHNYFEIYFSTSLVDE